MHEQYNDPEAPSRECSGWDEIVKCLEDFPASEVSYTEQCDVERTDWVFRGLADSCFCLEPRIEREALSTSWSWPALEKRVASEFKSRARMHLNAAMVPQDELTWLAQMQHYGIPTRLLDFTYSPFVALYFAIRDQTKEKKKREEEKKSQVRLWAINATEVDYQFKRVVDRAKAEVRKRAGKEDTRLAPFSNNPDDFYRDEESVISEIQGLQVLIAESLLATGSHRVELERQGCVAVASPPTFNPRLASQQGVFLVNCAGDSPFRVSINKMMKPCRVEWCKRFDIAIDAAPEIEQKLFRMNIHEQSLFPDMEGLAGFIRQKLRLHWK